MQFDFGKNWQDFSAAKLDEGRLLRAQEAMRDLVGVKAISDRSFLDIGCGTGLFSLAAVRLGSVCVRGFDVNPKSVAVSRENLERFIDRLEGAATPVFDEGSVLDTRFLDGLGRFDTVYSWGVLHHTGCMWDAIRNAAGCVAEGGTFVIAIYNRHWSSPAWKQIKRLYNLTPPRLRMPWNLLFGAIIYLAKAAVTRRNPLRKERGMDFWYDVIDWLGGYPYEYASTEEIATFVEELGFRSDKTLPAQVPTGCNEFVFTRITPPQTREPNESDSRHR